MNSLGQSRLASVVALLVGAWVAISPIWISVTGGALTSVIITGIVIAVAGLVQLFWKNAIPSWISGLAAVWLRSGCLYLHLHFPTWEHQQCGAWFCQQ